MNTRIDSTSTSTASGARPGRLVGKVALVTGSSKGIGRGIATRFAQEGADVVVNDNSDPKGAEDVVADITAGGRRAVAVQANLGTVAEVERLVADAVSAMGRRGKRGREDFPFD